MGRAEDESVEDDEAIAEQALSELHSEGLIFLYRDPSGGRPSGILSRCRTAPRELKSLLHGGVSARPSQQTYGSARHGRGNVPSRDIREHWRTSAADHPTGGPSIRISRIG